MRSQSLLFAPVAAVVVGLFLHYENTAGKEGGYPCSSFPFFSLYEKHGAARYDEAGNLTLSLRIDLHAPDCGAPDCYGHDMEVKVDVLHQKGKCRAVKAVSKNSTFTCADDTARAFVAGIPPVNVFTPLDNPDLSDPGLAEIVLHDRTHDQVLILRRDGYAFYEDGFPPGKGSDLSEESDPDFPATGSASRYWGME